MKKTSFIVCLFLLLFGCSKKHQPLTENKTITVNKPPAKIKRQGPLPKTLTVNDKIATKSVDGRLYFDLEGHRYWKNYQDGKYYMYNKSMYNDPAFKPQ